MAKRLLGLILLSLVAAGAACGQDDARLAEPDQPLSQPSFPSSANPLVLPEPTPLDESGAPGYRLPNLDEVVANYRFWFVAEYLAWWIKQSPIPVPLITHANLFDSVPGAIGQPGTVVLLGDNQFAYGKFNGARSRLGYWLDLEQNWGLEASYFELLGNTILKPVGSNSNVREPNLAIPFTNVLTGREDAGPYLGLPITLPGVLSGRDLLSLDSYLLGADFDVVHNLWSGSCFRLDLLLGPKYLQFQENLAFRTITTAIDGSGFELRTLDRFKTENYFIGGELALRLEAWWHQFFLHATARTALGSDIQRIIIDGKTKANFLQSPPDPETVYPGGLFAQPSNIGKHFDGRFAVVEEVTAALGYEIECWLRVFVGYNLIYASQIARAGDQIDRGLNPSNTGLAKAIGTFPVGPQRPSFQLHDADFWVQGVDLGFELRF